MPSIVLVFHPDIPAPKGHIPTIDMRDPYDPNRRIVVYPEEIDDGHLSFAMDPHVAAKVLSESEHVFKLWSPAKMRVPRVGAFGVQEVVTVYSINPAEKGEPVSTSVSEKTENAGAGAAAGSLGRAKAGKPGAGAAAGNLAVEPRISAGDVAAELDGALGAT